MTELLFMWVIMMGVFMAGGGPSQEHPAPVLVELFTSEGCSSCPPADRLLQEFDRAQSVPGAQLIVLSEHVDYWNHIGWTDPYSSPLFSERQNGYARHFGLESVYTPQMVVDGAAEFVGSDSRQATEAFTKARAAEKTAVRLSSISVDGGALRAHVEAGPLPPAFSGKAEVYVALALNRAESEVLRGENSGRHLTHVAVVKSITKVGGLEKAKAFGQDVRMKLPVGSDPSNLRVIAFVQETGQGRVMGAALEQVGK